MSSLDHIRRIAAKEQTLFFSSPVAYLFIGAFSALSLFIIFWGESFFARNIADTRPLFEWMPVLLIFLASALTMRLWSEERRTGTLEHVLTLPVPIHNFVLGKFLACLSLLTCALLTTVPFAVIVSFLGDLDWGPVFAGYLATFLLGAAYIAIGLFVSSKSSNQIVALLGSVAVCGFLYLLGSPKITELFGQHTSDLLRLLGTGSRFESITRGVVDLHDLAYYVGLIITFLSLNALALEAERWTAASRTGRQRDWRAVVLLLVFNAAGLNLWLSQVHGLRLDVTEGRQYSLSPATVKELNSLTEPLLIRGYFSQKTHPLLAPLVPQLKDLLQEYEAVAPGKVRVEIVDPQQNPELEQDAKTEFGIEPTPFQVADRYEASIVSSYFNVVVKYGDSHQTLGFKDLIEVKGHALENIDVQLRNPEYDITRAIKKTVDSYQKQGKMFDTLSNKVTLHLVISAADTLPEKLRDFRETVVSSSQDFQKKSDGKLEVEVDDPTTQEAGKELVKKYGLRPMASSLVDTHRFYFYILMSQGDKVAQIPLSDFSKANFESNFKSALQRFGSGFTNTVALVSKAGSSYQQLRSFLGDELNVVNEDLNDGRVSGAAQVLLLLDPDKLSSKALFAVDQFLMRGGTVIACTNPFQVEQSNSQLSLRKTDTGLEKWLQHFGIQVSSTLVEDSQCKALPIPVTRYVGGYQMQDMRLIKYPYFVDVRDNGIDKDQPALSDLGQLTMSWPSPIVYDAPKGSELKYTELLKSSDTSWLNPSTLVMPQVDSEGRAVMTPIGEQKSHTLGLLAQGTFSSYFESDEGKALNKDLGDLNAAAIASSPATARLIVLSSPTMFSDQMIRLFASMGAGDALSNLTLLGNTVDWACQDESLLSIRSRSHFKRTLRPLERRQQMMWEYLTYFLALLVLGIIAAIQWYRTEKKKRLYRNLFGS